MQTKLLFSQMLTTKRKVPVIEQTDLDMTSRWAYNWKMSFNTDHKNSAQDVLFSRKNSNMTHPVIYFNNIQVQRANRQKRLRIILDEKKNKNFKCHLDKVLTKNSQDIAVIKRLRIFLSRKSLFTIYKAFTRLHLDYGDLIIV